MPAISEKFMADMTETNGGDLMKVQIWNPKGKCWTIINREKGIIEGHSKHKDNNIPIFTHQSIMDSADGNLPLPIVPPVVEIPKTELCRNVYGGEKKWKVQTLIAAVEKQGCEVFDLPLSGIDLENLSFEIKDLNDFIFEVDIMNKCSLDYPIILSWTGAVADGFHRIAKAITQGRTSIKAYRLKRYVEPDY